MSVIINAESGEEIAVTCGHEEAVAVIRNYVKVEKKGDFDSYQIIDRDGLRDAHGQYIVIPTKYEAEWNARKAIEEAVSAHWNFGDLDKEAKHHAFVGVVNDIMEKINVRGGVYAIAGENTVDGKDVTVRWEGKFNPQNRAKYSEVFLATAMKRAVSHAAFLEKAKKEIAAGTAYYKDRGSRLSKLYYQMLTDDCGVVGAFRLTDPADDGMPEKERKRLTRLENLQRTGDLFNFIERPYLWITATDGSYVENYGTAATEKVRELAFFVTNICRDKPVDIRGLVVEAGKKFDRDFVLFIPKKGDHAEIIGTRDGGWPGLDTVVKISKASLGKENAFMTAVPDCPLSFNECEERSRCITPKSYVMRNAFGWQPKANKPFFSEELSLWKNYGRWSEKGW